MNEWEAKYNIIACGAEPRHIEAAEAAVRAAYSIAAAMGVPRDEVLAAVANAAHTLVHAEPKPSIETLTAASGVI